MLTNLYIENFVLIDILDLEFHKGLCVLTGETGAGKSILLDALGMVMGHRASASLVRPGTKQASVTAVFDVLSDHSVFKTLQSHDFFCDADDEEPNRDEDFVKTESCGDSPSSSLVIRRVVTSQGKSKAFLNDKPISISLLKLIAAELCEIHGQFDQILQPSTHKTLLDRFGDYEESLLAVSKTFKTFYALKQEQSQLLQSLENQDNQKAFLEASVKELDLLAPGAGEEAELLEKRTLLQNQEKVLEGVKKASLIISHEKGLQDLVGTALTAVEKSARFVPEKLESILTTFHTINDLLMDADASLNSFCDDFAQGDECLDHVDDRLHALRSVARKHGCLVAELPDIHESMSQELKTLQNFSTNLEAVNRHLTQAKQDYKKQAETLSQLRAEAAQKLSQAVESELHPLKLEQTRFKVHMSPLDEGQWSENGMDHVEFMVQTNPGLPFGSILTVASGGERSRLMLAMKVVLAHKSAASILIFDEIDSGVGGSVATAIGQRMVRLGVSQQVLAVTHSPQVAACAHHHYFVTKETKNHMTSTKVAKLSKSEAHEEIARMLSGDLISDEARAAASNLMS